MTSYPTEDNHHHWWLTPSKQWRILHAIPGAAVDPDDEDAVDSLRIEGITATAACGVTTRWSWPGVFSRLGKPRCAHCCRALGIPRGDGTPANDTSRKQREEAAS